MHDIEKRFGLYGILTNPVKGYDYLAKLFVEYRIRLIQLRIKDRPVEEITKIAEQIRKITEGTRSLFIVNDSPIVAKAVSADGVHIGQGDQPFHEVRSFLGKQAIIGLSTHSPAQATEACLLKPQYIGTGPVFPTPTKKIADPAIGIDGMSLMVKCATVPAVAIGGIDLSNLRAVLETGAENFCMVRQLTQANDPEAVVRETIKIYSEFYPGIMGS